MRVADAAVGCHYIDDAQLVANAQIPVVRIMCWCDLEETSCELRLRVDRIATECNGHDDVIIFNNRDHATHDRQTHELATKCSRARIFGIDADSGVAKHRLRPRGRDRHRAAAICEWILQVPEVSIHLFHLNFIVRKRRLGCWIPVDKTLSTVNQAICEELEERLAHSGRTCFVHRESRAIKVTGATHRSQLRENRRFILIFPFLHLRHKLRAREVCSTLALQLKPLLHHGLRRDTRMIRSRHPQCFATLHAVIASEQILKRVVKCVTKVQCGSHIRWRNEDRERWR